jgi:hypothetical protein
MAGAAITAAVLAPGPVTRSGRRKSNPQVRALVVMLAKGRYPTKK